MFLLDDSLPRSAGVGSATTSIASTEDSSSELLAYATIGNRSFSALMFIAKNGQKGNLEKKL